MKSMCKKMKNEVQVYKRKQLLNLDDVALDKAVKIQGTQFDRKRKLDDKQIKQIKRFYKAGMSYEELGALYGVDPRTIRYNVDDNYAVQTRAYMRLVGGKHTGQDNITIADRVAYKRDLIATRKIKAETIEVKA